MVFPYAYWPTRFVQHLYADQYQTVAGELRSAHIDELNGLERELGECDMSCESFMASLADLADAIRESQRSLTVNCGTGASCGPLSPIETALQTLGEESLLTPDDLNDEGEEPPDGFDDWEEYRIYKCKAAHWIADTFISGVRNLGMLGLTAGVLNIGVGSVVGALGLLGAVAVPPLAFVALMGVLAQMVLVAGAANTVLVQLADRLQERRLELVCAMYKSGSAGAAVTAVTGLLDEVIDTLVYSGPLAGLGGAIGPLVGVLMGHLVNLNLMQTLFRVVADVVYLGEDCSECYEAESMPFTFDSDEQGWYWDDTSPPSGWSYDADWSDAGGAVPGGYSAGQLYASVTNPGNSDWYPAWRKNMLPYDIISENGMQLSLHARTSQKTGSDCQLGVVFTDNTEVFTWYNQTLDTTFSLKTIDMPESSWGKKIRAIRLVCRVKYATAGTRAYWFDNVDIG